MVKRVENTEEFESNETPFDAEETLQENLANLPEETEIVGTWKFKFVNGFATGGTSAKGPWKMLNLRFDPIEPVGDHDYSEADLNDLPHVMHRVFWTSNRDKRAFVSLAAKLNTEAAPLEEMFADMKGEMIIATAKPGKDNRGETVTRLSNFRQINFRQVAEELDEAA